MRFPARFARIAVVLLGCAGLAACQHTNEPTEVLTGHIQFTSVLQPTPQAERPFYIATITIDSPSHRGLELTAPVHSPRELETATGPLHSGYRIVFEIDPARFAGNKPVSLADLKGVRIIERTPTLPPAGRAAPR